MMSSTSEVTLEFLKYALTGGISFGASLLYTNWALQPAYNVSLIPLSVTLPKSNKGCDVNQKKLKEKIQGAKDTNSPVGPAPPEGYESYLEALSANTWVRKEVIPSSSFLKRL